MKFILIAFAAGLAASACKKEPPPKVYVAKGTVQEVHADAKEVIIDGEEIPGYMEAMTMPYHVRDAKVLQGVVAKEKVVFRLAVTPSEEYIEGIEPARSR